MLARANDGPTRDGNDARLSRRRDVVPATLDRVKGDNPSATATHSDRRTRARHAHGARNAQRDATAARHLQRGTRQASRAPRNVDFDATARPQPVHASLRPIGRERRQQVNGASVRLEQHLGDGRRPAKVPIDLKRLPA